MANTKHEAVVEQELRRIALALEAGIAAHSQAMQDLTERIAKALEKAKPAARSKRNG